MFFHKAKQWGWGEEGRVWMRHVPSSTKERGKRVGFSQWAEVTRLGRTAEPPFGAFTPQAWTFGIWKPARGPRQRLIKPQMNQGFYFHVHLATGPELSCAAVTTFMGSSLLEKKKNKKQEGLIGSLCCQLACRLFFFKGRLFWSWNILVWAKLTLYLPSAF